MRVNPKISKFIHTGLSYSLMIVLSFIFLYPTFLMVLNALQDPTGQGYSFANFSAVFTLVPFSRYTLNSLIIVIITISIGLLVNSMLAYVLARLRWRWATLILGIVIAVMVFPFEALAVPLLLLTNLFGWLDSIHVQIVPFIADPFSIFLFYQFFRKFPKDLEDAALVDGLGRWRIYWQILVPNSAPAFATAAILKFLFLWDSYLWPMMVTRGPTARPLTVGFRDFFAFQNFIPQSSAYALLMTLPTLILFIFLQRWFVQSVTATGKQE
jgi:multiple sugar transport system permease protein